MNTQIQATMAPAVFSLDEQRRLLVLRARYHQTGDLFTAAEMERLRFLRWLSDAGQLAS